MAGNKVYVQGSYVDVHDNGVVNLSVEKAGEVCVDGSSGENAAGVHGEREAREARAAGAERSCFILFIRSWMRGRRGVFMLP